MKLLYQWRSLASCQRLSSFPSVADVLQTTLKKQLVPSAKHVDRRSCILELLVLDASTTEQRNEGLE